MNSIFERRSIRKFTNKKISDINLQEILRAGMCAPSAHNQKSWSFIVIKDKEIFKTIMQLHPYSSMLKTADIVIMVCSTDINKVDFWAQDCSAATQNILLEATALGLGSCWLGVYPIHELCERLRTIFNIPNGNIPFSLVALGYPDEQKEPNNLLDKNKIHYEKW